MEQQPTLLKDFFNEGKVSHIGRDLLVAYPRFDLEGFIGMVMNDLDELSLSERAWSITEAMRYFLPKYYEEVAEIFKKTFGPELHSDRMEGMDGFYYMPFGNYVAKYGLDHFEISMDLLRDITIRFTSEFPIRPFLEKYPERTLSVLKKWVHDPNVHVRRLVSEGSRPRLPWASRLRDFQKDPTLVLELLEQLKEDPELYVRRSVANNLNDLGKDHPELVLDVLINWSCSKDLGTQWIIKHASRSLIKDGNPKALNLLGYDPKVKVELVDLQVEGKVEMGDTLNFSFSILSKEMTSKELMVDFVVHYMKANGKLAPKVFKLAKTKIRSGEYLEFKKKVSFKPISTRKYHQGLHAIEIQVNGTRFGKGEFELIMT